MLSAGHINTHDTSALADHATCHIATLLMFKPTWSLRCVGTAVAPFVTLAVSAMMGLEVVVDHGSSSAYVSSKLNRICVHVELSIIEF